MFKSLFDIVKQLLGLSKDTQENKDAIAVINKRVETLTDALKQVVFELRRLEENEAHEREKMALRLENALLRSERALPVGNADETATLIGLQKQVAMLQQEMESLKRRVELLEKSEK